MFTKKGNERQYCFNEDVKDKFWAVAAVLDTTAPEVEKAKALLIDKWQKLADRSEHGWSTIDEYVEDKLADDSDNENMYF